MKNVTTTAAGPNTLNPAAAKNRAVTAAPGSPRGSPVQSHASFAVTTTPKPPSGQPANPRPNAATTTTKSTVMGGLRGGEKPADVQAKKLQEIVEKSKSHGAAIETLRALIAHSKLVEAMREDSECPQGHRLEPVGTTMDDGWCCACARDPEGCKSLLTETDQSLGLNRFRCEECDYDLCEDCYKLKTKSALLRLELRETADTAVETAMQPAIHKLAEIVDIIGVPQEPKDGVTIWSIMDNLRRRLDGLEALSIANAARSRTDTGALRIRVDDLEGRVESLKKQGDAGVVAAEQSAIQLSTSRFRLDELDTRMDGLAGINQANEDFRKRWQQLDEANRAAVNAAAQERGTLRIQVESLSHNLSTLVGQLDVAFTTAASLLKSNRPAERTVNMQASTGDVWGVLDTLSKRFEDIFALAGEKLRSCDGKLEQVQLDFMRKKSELEESLRRLAAQTGRDMEAMSSQCKRVEDNCPPRSVQDLCGKLQVRVDVLEAQRLKDSIDMAAKVDTHVSGVIMDRELDVREKRLTERVDLVATHIGTSMKKLERRFIDLKTALLSGRRPPELDTHSPGSPSPSPPSPRVLSPTEPNCLPILTDGEWNYRVDWEVSDKEFSIRGTRGVDSPSFSLGSVHGLLLRFHPMWNSSPRTCLLALVSPESLNVCCQLFVDSAKKSGSALPLLGEAGSTGKMFYAAEFPVAPNGRYSVLAVEFAGCAVAGQGLLRLA